MLLHEYVGKRAPFHNEQLESLSNSIYKGYDETSGAARSQLTKQQILYYMKQSVGKKSGFWVEILCSLLLSTHPFEDVYRANEFMTRQRFPSFALLTPYINKVRRVDTSYFACAPSFRQAGPSQPGALACSATDQPNERVPLG